MANIARKQDLNPDKHPVVNVYLSNTNIQVGNNNNGSINSTSMVDCRIMQETIKSQADTIKSQQVTIDRLLSILECYSHYGGR